MLLYTSPVMAVKSITEYTPAHGPLTQQQKKRIYQLDQPLELFETQLAQVDSVDWLLGQLKLAQAMKRDDIVLSTLERLFAIEGNNVSGLYYQANMYLQTKQLDKATAAWKKLQQLAPKSQKTLALNSIFSIRNEKKSEFQRARLLAHSGRYLESLLAYDSVFPNGIPTPSLQLEYLQVEGHIASRWQSVKTSLEKLNANNPDVPIFQLALTKHIGKRHPADPWVLASYRRLALRPDIGEQAALSWLYALDSLPISTSVTEQYAILSSYYPSNRTIQRANQEGKKRLARELILQKDPTYRAKRKGLALLDEGKNNQAAKQLRYALTTRPDDPELLGAIGTIYLRGGNQTQALAYFKKAQELDKDPDAASKWRSLIKVSSYWAYLKQGDTALKENRYTDAKHLYEKSIKITPAAPDAYNGLAELALMQKQYKQAERYYQLALNRDQNNNSALRGRLNVALAQGELGTAIKLAEHYTPQQQLAINGKIQSLRSDQASQAIELALSAGDMDQAKRSVSRLLALKPSSPWLRADIADTLRILGNPKQADDLMLAWDQASSDPQMHFAYSLYLSRNDQARAAVDALAAVPKTRLTPAMKRNLVRLSLNLDLDNIQARYLYAHEASVKAISKLAQEYRHDPQAMMRITETWYKLGEATRAQTSYAAITPQKDWSFSTQLAYAKLMLTMHAFEDFNDWQARSEHLSNLTLLSISERQSLHQLATQANIAEAEQDYQQELYASALARYLKVSKQAEPYKTQGLIGVLQSSIPLEQQTQYEYIAAALYSKRGQLTASQLMSVARVFNRLGRHTQANHLNELLPDSASAMEFRDSMAIAMTNKQWHTAGISGYKALNSDRIAKNRNQDKASPEKPSLHLLYDQADDYWLTRNVKKDIDTLHDRLDGHVMIGYDFGARDGENKMSQVPIEARIPIPSLDGHLILRAEHVNIASGDIDYLNQHQDHHEIPIDQQASGTALGVGWEADNWSADIGTTPLGFTHSTWVGGITVKGDLADLGWRINASKRPETSSILSYAGLSVPQGSIDPQGTEWGGVVRTGLKIGTSYDQGGPYGIWTSIQYHKLTGDNVADNTRLGLLAGSYYKLIADEDQGLSVGTNFMYLNYNKNLSEYTLGHGGYYSPQSYFSVSIPVNYYKRYHDTWSYLLSGSISNSWTQEDGPYLTGEASSSGGGFGYTFQAAIENRISKHWYLGMSLDLQRSDFYEPNHFILYAKYTFSDRWQSITMPANTPILYSSFD
ncbi:cellulose synthase subunit BcsC-related outer membrane protein [Shewanella violacea]|uniref:cellulose synthase subunit BcsC-related outer membrane protein n=1 Tax=Shewanella violacea TaxID=60217 RepID=UPI0003078CED|nr:cellulose synthase subunit BcsC-related outer membrane protein [Shewanella violacea]